MPVLDFVGRSRRWGGAASALALGCALIPPAGVAAQAQPAEPAKAAAAPAQVTLRDDQVQLLVRTLGEAPANGFSAGEFALADITALLGSTDPEARQRGQALLARSAIAYARAQHGARAPVSGFSSDWSIQPAAYDAAADFNFAAANDKLAAWAANLAPPFERYRILATLLTRYQAIAAKGGWEPVAAGPALKPGMSDPRIVALRQRLAAENTPGLADLTSPAYDPKLAAVVAQVQARYGLTADGVVAAATLKALNVPAEARVQQISANMERWRWMPRAWPGTRIEVNIAAAQLSAFQDNRPVDEMKVVVGAPDKKTPMLISEIHSVVLNPPWNVPTSIATKELLPKGPGYLARNGFTWVSNGAGGTRLRQKPGPNNSLGRIKFDFDNSFGVYLHDTDAKTAFGRDARSVSHGCVRVERPEELANMLLGADSRWSPERLQQVLDDKDTVRASLPQRIPVVLAYWTVFTDAQGLPNFRNDIYGWDDQLLDLLNNGKSVA